MICRKGSGKRVGIGSTFIKRSGNITRGQCRACYALLTLSDVRLEKTGMVSNMKGTLPIHVRKRIDENQTDFRKRNEGCV